MIELDELTVTYTLEADGLQHYILGVVLIIFGNGDSIFIQAKDGFEVEFDAAEISGLRVIRPSKLTGA